MVDALMLPFIEVQGQVEIRPYNVGEVVPVAKAIPQPEQLTGAAVAMEKRPKCLKLLAYWRTFDCVTADQLQVMMIVLEAHNHFNLVKQPTQWIDKVEWGVSDMCSMFADTSAVTKVWTLDLGMQKYGKEEVMGYKLLDFRENLWLHTTSILMSLLVLSKEYDRVGICTIGSFASSASGNHWVAFLADKKAKVCKIFDPLEPPKNYTIIQESVESVEGWEYETVDWCKRKDGSSCGIWCIAVLEMLSDNTYRLQPYLRMRYLHKVIGLLTAPE
ncbi:hypothetical protein PHMEG_00012155 [Phytophthora megakarya]|uniref:Ubiquitin-like protease family profile domain-containing protein n=1 Tax=Phytophthora megakarya TaxID=4795 RepID=A0A225WAE2_9STRA|nr:hypothetical protein PHMEG_00012155 [Phytophthora megakarya]